MRNIFIVTIISLLSILVPKGSAQEVRQLYPTTTLTQVVDSLVLYAPQTRIKTLNLRNEILRQENYHKSFLPALQISFAPISFNRSLRLLQSPVDGSYSNVEDYTNQARASFNIQQRVPWTGGQLSVGSGLNLLSEFKSERHNFSSNIFNLAYSQKLWGGYRLFEFERKLEKLKANLINIHYCSEIAKLQKQATELYIRAIQAKIRIELAKHQLKALDKTLLTSDLKLKQKQITQYDYNQIELQKLNQEYQLNESKASYKNSLKALSLFLDYDIKAVSLPKENLPLLIDYEDFLFHMNKNNLEGQERTIKKLNSEQALYQAKLNRGIANSTLSLNYGMNQYANNFIGAYQHGNVQQSLSLNLQIPIFQWGIGRNKLQIAKNQYSQTQIQLEEERKNFELRLQKLVEQYNQCIKQWLLSKRAYQLAIENYNRSLKLFSFGKISIHQLLTVAREQKSMQTRYIAKMGEVYSLYYELRSLALYDFKEKVELIQLFVKLLRH